MTRCRTGPAACGERLPRGSMSPVTTVTVCVQAKLFTRQPPGSLTMLTRTQPWPRQLIRSATAMQPPVLSLGSPLTWQL